jgi:G:T/U-mismatch repair DNA glycosylase
MMDLIQSCSRRDNSNLDNNLENITWNRAAFDEILATENIKCLFCTGKGVALILKKWFPLYIDKIVALPSPSPRYANINFEEKRAFYESVFPEKT